MRSVPYSSEPAATFASQNQAMADEMIISITPSQVLEYLYCPRFIYFMECLKIAQHEEQRFKVQQGRSVHEQKMRTNPGYLRQKIGAINKASAVYLASSRLHVRGVVDEVLELRDGTMAPLEYKFAVYQDYLFKTHKTQLALQALLIQENYARPVTRGFLVYTRSNHLLREIPFQARDFDFARRIVAEVLTIIQTGYYPKATGSRAKCTDCCYKNICVH